MIQRKHVRILIFVAALITIILINISAHAADRSVRRHIVRKVWYSNDTVTVDLDRVSPGVKLRFTYHQLSGNRFYIDIHNSIVSRALFSRVNLDDVRILRRAQFDRNTSRVVIQFNRSGIKPVVTYNESPTPQILVSWYGSATAAGKKKFKILIDAGHGGRDVGAVGPVKRIKEKDVTLDIALKLKRLLERRKEVVVELTRRSDITIKPSARRRISRRWKPDLFISIHANSSAKNKRLNQTEIYYYDRRSIPLAQIVRDGLIDELERSEGQIRRMPFTVINKNPATFGSVLVESCYISSRRGENYLSQDWYRNEIARGLDNSIGAFLNRVGSKIWAD